MLIDKYLYILPECYIDTCFCKLLLQIEKVNHKTSFGDVAREFRRGEENNRGYVGKFWDSPALGLIDRDNIKDKSDFFRDGKNFNTIKKLPNLSLIQRKSKSDHYCIIVEPDMERFLLAIAKEINVTSKEFSFLSDLSSFTSVSKTQKIYYNPDFKRFVNQLIEKESETILTLKNWLQQFYDNLKIEV